MNPLSPKSEQRTVWNDCPLFVYFTDVPNILLKASTTSLLQPLIPLFPALFQCGSNCRK
jgi:hypothetical protein